MPEPKIIQRKDCKRDGTALLYIQLYFKRNPHRINLGISVKPSQFDAIREKITSKHPNHRDLNLFIQRKLSEVNEALIRFRLSGEPLTKTTFKRNYYNPTASEDFLAFWENEMSLQFQRGVFSEVTMVRHKRNLKRLREYTLETLKQKALYFYQIDATYMAKFDIWLMNLMRENGVANGRPEREKMQKSIKKFLTVAKREGKKFKDPFPPGSKVRYKTPERVWMSEEELGRMYELFKNRKTNEFLTRSLRIVLRSYLFQCFSGLRYSDVRETLMRAMQRDYIKILPKKTEQDSAWLKVHMNEPLRELLKGADLERDRKYVVKQQRLKTPPLIPTLTEPYTNKLLKKLAKMARINKRISTHAGRHTFATLFLEKGGSIEVLQKLLGHKNIKATMTYVHLSDQRPGAEVRGVFDGFN